MYFIFEFLMTKNRSWKADFLDYFDCAEFSEKSNSPDFIAVFRISDGCKFDFKNFDFSFFCFWILRICHRGYCSHRQAFSRITSASCLWGFVILHIFHFARLFLSFLWILWICFLRFSFSSIFSRLSFPYHRKMLIFYLNF